MNNEADSSTILLWHDAMCAMYDRILGLNYDKGSDRRCKFYVTELLGLEATLFQVINKLTFVPRAKYGGS